METKFKSYPKIHRLGKEETDGILDGPVTVQEKVDGANVSIWLDGGTVRGGSRTRELGDDEFNGFTPYIRSNPLILEWLQANPTKRLYGEWLVKHTITYWEMYVVNKYCTMGRVQKVMQKLQPTIDRRLDMEHTSQIAGSCYHDLVTEEAWAIFKKVPKLDTKKLQGLCMRKFIQIYHDILNNSISVADGQGAGDA